MNDAAKETRDGTDPARPPSARRYDHTFIERYIFIPIAILWLGLLALLAFPIMILMTLLYYLTRPFVSLLPPSRRSPSRAADRQNPAA